MVAVVVVVLVVVVIIYSVFCLSISISTVLSITENCSAEKELKKMIFRIFSLVSCVFSSDDDIPCLRVHWG